MKYNFFSHFFSQIFLIYIKMTRKASAKYYQKNKEKIEKTSGERYQILTEGERNRKKEYGCEWCKNLSEDEKQKLVE